MTMSLEPRLKKTDPLIALSATLLLACSSSHSAPPAGPRVVLPTGATIHVELALTPDEIGQGLMFRPSMPRDAGMVFIFDRPDVRAFWMKNCHFPLDMVFTLKDGTVVDVLENVPPCKADPCSSYPPKAAADTVVELNAGIAKANKVVPGSKVRFLEIPAR